MDELDELAALLREREGQGGRPQVQTSVTPIPWMEGEQSEDAFLEERPSVRGRGQVVQWTTGDGKVFLPSGEAHDSLPPGAYAVGKSMQLGLYFETIPVKTEGLLELPSSNFKRVTTEIAKFWEREHIFSNFGLAYKRGILLWGPAGCGKSSCIQMLMRDVISRGGIVVEFTQPQVFIEGYRVLRDIQPETPVIVVMEDLDSIVEAYGESEVLVLLDGIERVNRIVFVASTNYPERLGDRIVNRPSRFDKRFKIGYPDAESRRLYLVFLIDGKVEVDVDQWVRDSEHFSLAHLKELFTAVVILGDDYQDALKTLRSMKENKIGSHKDDDPDEGEGPLSVGGYA